MKSIFTLHQFFFVIGWIHDYKAVTLGFDWLIDCVIRYSFIPFSHLHQIKPVEYSLVKSANLDESLFEFNTS